MSNNVFSQEIQDLDFSLLRQNDKIEIKEVNSFYQRVKKTKLAKEATISFGGGWRFQTESFINEQFDKRPDQNNYWFLNRFMLHSHLKIGNSFEVFSEINSSLISNKANLTPVDKDELSFNQLFAQYNFNAQWNILLGRQNMRLGSGRLVDVREGPNVRLAFDLVQLHYKNQNSLITTFYAIPVQQQIGVFDNNALDINEIISSLYWTQNWTENTNTDLYILYKEEAYKTWEAGTADDKRTSVGLRHFGTWKGFNYNNEFVHQFGTFDSQNIIAWTASFNIEKVFNPQNPFTIGVKTEAISGDKDITDSYLNTFDALYPRGAYFGRVARFGPSNLIDIHPYLKTSIRQISLEMDYVAFWRYSSNDGIYNPALILEYPSLNNERFIGNQIGAVAGYEVNNFFILELESNVIFPGAFLQKSNQGDILYHFVFTTEVKF